MSIDAYKVAVKISLVENVTRGLGMMARHFRTTDAEAKVLEARLKSIGKMAMFGGALATAGALGLSLFKKPIEEATEYERKLAQLRQMGLGNAQIADAQKFVEANRIMGTSINDRMRLFMEAQGSFRQSGMGGAEAISAAKTMMPVLAQYEVATKMLGGDHQQAAEGSMRNLNKIIEIMGGLTDTKRAQAIADGVFKAAQSSGRMVDERQLKQFVAYGSSATNQLGLRAIFGGLEPIIGEMGGSTTGVGLRTAYNRVNGMMALMPRRTREELGRLGMADATGKQQTTDLARLQATDIIGYAQEVMRRYQKAGITTQVDRERENAILFGTNGAKIFNKIMSQMPVLLESLKAFDAAHGTSDVANDPKSKALKAYMDLEKKESDLKLRIGQVVLPYYIRALELMANALERVNAFAKANPTAFKSIILVFGAVSAAALAGGSLALLVAGFRAFALLAGPLRLVWTVLQIGGTTLRYLGLAVFQFGRFLLANPIGLALAAIIFVGWSIYKNWKEIKASGLKIWNDIKEAWNKLLNGDLLGALGSFASAYIRGWQTLFNTLIAGINSILPAALQISKFSFADRFDAWMGGEGAGSGIKPSGGSPIQVATSIMLDGIKVAESVSRHQARAAGRPSAGGSRHNPSAPYSRPQPVGR